MHIQEEFIEELRLRLKTPWIALGRIAKGQYLPKIFAEAALSDLKKALELVMRLENQKKG